MNAFEDDASPFSWAMLSLSKAAVLPLCLAMAACATVKHPPVLTPPVLKKAMTPVYPRTAMMANHVGVMVMKISVRASGKVSDVSLVKTAGFNELDQAAMFPAHFWYFTPATADGVATDSTIRIPVSFSRANDGNLAVVICQALPPSAPDNESTACPMPSSTMHQDAGDQSLETPMLGNTDLEKGYEAERKGDYVAALTLFRPLAEQGDARAQRSMGLFYRYGRGVAENDMQALLWFGRSALRGNSAAMNDLGMMYLDGRGVPRDFSKAAFWFKRSALLGSPFGQSNLALSYARGDVEGKADFVVGYALLVTASPALQAYPTYANSVAKNLKLVKSGMTPSQMQLGDALAQRIQQEGLAAAMADHWNDADHPASDSCKPGPDHNACEKAKVDALFQQLDKAAAKAQQSIGQ
jgi:TonB family protein